MFNAIYVTINYLQLAEWAEIDRTEAVWTVLATRMKMRREQWVPLCGRATEILEEARTLGGGSPLVFTPGDGKPIFEKLVRRLLRKLRIGFVRHARLQVIDPDPAANQSCWAASGCLPNCSWYRQRVRMATRFLDQSWFTGR